MLQIITTWESNNNQGTTLKFPCGVGITAPSYDGKYGRLGHNCGGLNLGHNIKKSDG